MQAGGGATGQAAVFGGRNGVVWLELVKFDPGFKQGFAVLDVAVLVVSVLDLAGKWMKM